MAIFGVVAGFSYYVLTVRNAQNNQKLAFRNQEISLRNQEETLRTRNAAIYQQLMAPIISTEWGVKRVHMLEANPVSSHEEWRELIRSNPEYYEAWSWVVNIYEMIGAYVRKGIGVIEFFILHNIYWHLRFWRQNKPIIYKQREAWTRLLPKHGIPIRMRGEILGGTLRTSTQTLTPYSFLNINLILLLI